MFSLLVFSLFITITVFAQKTGRKPNVLFIIADDLNVSALGAYGNKVMKTPAIDQLAKEGIIFNRAYSQFPVCGPSRASLMFGYYPSATETYGYVSGREQVGPDRFSMAQWFKHHGYYTARVGKIFHMGVPIDIEKGTDGEDDIDSWTERFNSQGPEWQSEGKAELVQNNPDGAIERKGGNVMTIVKAAGGELVQADGKTTQKAIELIRENKNKPFFIAVGFVRPHVPFVAPEKYFAYYPWEQIVAPAIVDHDWADIPKAGINYVTTQNAQMDMIQKKKAIAGYYASVSFVDNQVGKIMDALKTEGLEKNTIVVFVSDHGFHLGEHDYWMKVSLLEESVQVPMIIKAPKTSPGKTESLVELVDIYPTLAELAGLPIPENIQGKSLAPVLKEPGQSVKDAVFSVSKNGKSYLFRNDRWAYIQYGEQGESGMELYDMYQDPKQFTNLAMQPAYEKVLIDLQAKLKAKLAEIRKNDLGKDYDLGYGDVSRFNKRSKIQTPYIDQLAGADK